MRLARFWGFTRRPMTSPSPTTRPDKDLLTGLALGVVGVTIFGLTLPATRVAVRELDPLFITGGRAVLAGLVGGALLWAYGRRAPPRETWGRFAVFGIGAILGFPLFMVLAMERVPAGHGGVVLAIMPMLTAIFGVIVAGERPSLGFWACGLAGMAAVVAYSLLSGALTGADFGVGDLLLLLAACSACSAYAIGGKLSRSMPGWEVICWALVMALPVMLVVTFAGRGITWDASPTAWLCFLYTSLFSMLLGFFAWNRGLALGGIAKVGQVQLLQTFVTLLASWAFLGERVGLLEIAFSILVVGIVALGSRMRVRQTETAR